MEVPLPPKYEKMVREKVEHGWYRSATDVIEQALQLLEERDAAEQVRLDQLRADIRAGFDQLDRGESVDSSEVFRRLRERNAALNK